MTAPVPKETQKTIDSLIQRLSDIFTTRNLTLATAESCTGGMIGAAITTLPGVSSFFKGGIIAYSNEIKRKILQVPEKTLVSFGAVSRETVTVMAEGACGALKTDCAISVSGIAGPGGATDQKPVGTVWIGVRTPGKTEAYHFVFDGTREKVREAATHEALKAMVRELNG